jgi:phage RecT family recombinase
MQAHQSVAQQAPIGIKRYLEEQEDRVIKILDGSKDIQAKSLINKFLFALGQNEKLMQCNQQSIKNALLFCATKRMAPINNNIILIPYGNECQASLGIKGLRELMSRNPRIKSVTSEIVRETDECRITAGSNPSINHTLDLSGSSPILGAYAIAELHNGNTVMRYSSLKEINEAKACSKGSGSPSSPWNKFFGEMARLVPLRKLAKELILDGDNTFDTFYGEENRQRDSEGTLQTLSSDGEFIEAEGFTTEGTDVVSH